VLAPGLLALAQEMRKLGHVSILAPDRNWSGGGHVKTLDRALRVKEFHLEDGTTAYGADGAPSDLCGSRYLWVTSRNRLIWWSPELT